MKRVPVIILLGVVVVAAIFAFKNIGLFSRSNPFGHTPGSAAFGPGVESLAAVPQVQPIAFPGAGAGAPVMSERQIEKVLDSWTYPHAVDATYEYFPPGASPQQKAAKLGRYTRLLDVYAPEARVFAFYAQKAGSPSMPASYFQHLEAPPPPGAAPPPSDMGGLPPVPVDTANYSKLAKNYLVQVSLSFQVNIGHTRVILQLAPRTKN